MDHLAPEYVTAAKILLVSSAICFGVVAKILLVSSAICFGVVAAKLRHPSVETQIRRGDCPQCKARKSLRATPISSHSVMFTCGDCVGQWLVESPDEKMVVYGPADQPALPPLRMEAHSDGRLEFRTDAGRVVFDTNDLGAAVFEGLRYCANPRHKLNFLYHAGVAPHVIQLVPDQRLKSIVAECTSYQWFAASAGLDIYHLMPGYTDCLHGTTENHDD